MEKYVSEINKKGICAFLKECPEFAIDLSLIWRLSKWNLFYKIIFDLKFEKHRSLSLWESVGYRFASNEFYALQNIYFKLTKSKRYNYHRKIIINAICGVKNRKFLYVAIPNGAIDCSSISFTYHGNKYQLFLLNDTNAHLLRDIIIEHTHPELFNEFFDIIGGYSQKSLRAQISIKRHNRFACKKAHDVFAHFV